MRRLGETRTLKVNNSKPIKQETLETLLDKYYGYIPDGLIEKIERINNG